MQRCDNLLVRIQEALALWLRDPVRVEAAPEYFRHGEIVEGFLAIPRAQGALKHPVVLDAKKLDCASVDCFKEPLSQGRCDFIPLVDNLNPAAAPARPKPPDFPGDRPPIPAQGLQFLKPWYRDSPDRRFAAAKFHDCDTLLLRTFPETDRQRRAGITDEIGAPYPLRDMKMPQRQVVNAVGKHISADLRKRSDIELTNPIAIDRFSSRGEKVPHRDDWNRSVQFGPLPLGGLAELNGNDF